MRCQTFCCCCYFPCSADHERDWLPYVCCMVIIYSKSKDQPGKVANPARG